MQKLILPIDNCKIVANFFNKQYKKYWGFNHWGCDYVSTNNERTVFASGTGKVLKTGYDKVFGNIIIILYKDVNVKGGSYDLVARYYHFNKIFVNSGDSVKYNTAIGEMGTTGKYSSGVHLHVEFDTDTKNYLAGGPLNADSNIIKKGYPNTLVNPSDVFFINYNQMIERVPASAYTSDEDVNLQCININDYESIDKLVTENEELKSQLDAYKLIINKIRELINQYEA